MKNNANPYKCKQHPQFKGKNKPQKSCDPCWMVYLKGQQLKGNLSVYIMALLQAGFKVNDFNPIVNFGKQHEENCSGGINCTKCIRGGF